jgi:intracellular septation protein A
MKNCSDAVPDIKVYISSKYYTRGNLTISIKAVLEISQEAPRILWLSRHLSMSKMAVTKTVLVMFFGQITLAILFLYFLPISQAISQTNRPIIKLSKGTYSNQNKTENSFNQ